MRADLFALRCDKLEDASFVGFRGTEQINRPYEIALFFTVPVGTSAKGAVGQRATLKADRGKDTEPVVFHGVIAQMTLLHQTAERALYRALLVPRLWLLRHFWRSYVFTFRTVKDFLSSTLTDGGLQSDEFRFCIDEGLYPEEEFVAQYRESHLDFFHRWLEREGLYYYFEHKADAAGEVLVIVDDKGLHEAFPGSGHVRYFPLAAGAAAAPESLHHLEADTVWLPKSITIKDYDYANPSASVTGEGSVSKEGCGVIQEYGYRVFAEKHARRLAEVRAQALGCRQTTLRARGDALGPRPGYRLAIDERPDDVDEEWLAIEVAHTGAISGMTAEVKRLTGLSIDGIYQIELLAVPASVQYRAPQTTTWPRIFGFENGVVSGPADSPYAQIDADGRYLVRFEFDTSELPDGKISTRVRMLQPHGGQTEGFHFPLRKGTEVMVGFLGGDPDRPFIAGVVPNAHKPAVVAERNYTQNIIRTGSNNQIVMEDEQGQEFIFVHTPNQSTGLYMGSPAGAHSKVYTGERDSTQLFTSPSCAEPGAGLALEGENVSLYPHTEGNAGSFIGQNSWQEVGGNESIFVQGNVAHGYRGTYDLKVGSATTENYYATRETTTHAARTDTVLSGGKTQNITDKLHQTIHGSGFQHVTSGWKHQVDAQNEDEYGSWKSTVTGAWNGSFAEGSVTIDATPSNLHIHSGGVINVDADGQIEIKAPSVSVKSTAFLKHYLSAKHETYSYKGATGIAKTDHAAIYQSAYGLKMDTVGVKIENEGAKKLTFGAIFRTIGFAQRVGGLSLRTVGVLIWNGTFKKS